MILQIFDGGLNFITFKDSGYNIYWFMLPHKRTTIAKGIRTSDLSIESSAFYSYYLQTRFNKIAIQGTTHMTVDKEAISLSIVYS